jgi:hypothetical protein
MFFINYLQCFDLNARIPGASVGAKRQGLPLLALQTCGVTLPRLEVVLDIQADFELYKAQAGNTLWGKAQQLSSTKQTAGQRKCCGCCCRELLKQFLSGRYMSAGCASAVGAAVIVFVACVSEQKSAGENKRCGKQSAQKEGRQALCRLRAARCICAVAAICAVHVPGSFSFKIFSRLL